MWPFTADKGVD